MNCSFCGRSDAECKIKMIRGLFFCPKHLSRYYRRQDMNERSIYDPNDYLLYEDHAEIVLRNKDGMEVANAIIDLDDVEKCKKYKWHLRRGHGDTDYVIASLPSNFKIHLHRYVLGYDGEDDVDHINRNGLDNRKINLRIVSHSVNTSNNKHTGIYRVKSGRYRASCCRDYKTIYIGMFDTFEEAEHARDSFLKSL